jgi:hypothetical protein
MAMDGSKLGQEIAEAIMNASAPADVKTQVTALWKKIGTAIVAHIVDNAEVLAGIPVSTSGGEGSTSGNGKVK